MSTLSPGGEAGWGLSTPNRWSSGLFGEKYLGSRELSVYKKDA